jgi:hypothetical protein
MFISRLKLTFKFTNSVFPAFLLCLISSHSYGQACAPISGGVDATISTSCNDLVMNGAGNVVINSSATIGNTIQILNSISDKNLLINGNLLGPIDIQSTSFLNLVTNNGTITTPSGGINVWGNVNTVTNNGNLYSDYWWSIQAEDGATITNLINTGIIRGHSAIGLNGQISYITNTGTIRSTGGDKDIMANSYGPIELNNSQGAAISGEPLTYQGILPTHYNIIINSVSDFGRIVFTNVTGTTTFGISSLSSGVSFTTYSDVLKGITDTQLGITDPSLTATSNGYLYTLSKASAYSTDFNWDLLVSAYTSQGPTAADTQASLNTQARRLRSTFNSTMASGNFANMNTYDCNLFDKNNMCISAGGRYTNIDNPSSNNSAAVVVLGYKVNSNIRIGGFLDQSLNNNTPTGIDISNKNPMMGAFAVWNHQADGLGYQVKIANAYQDKDVTSTRDAFGATGEAGTGKTNLNTQSYVGELSYAFNYQDSTIVRPYFAVRYTNIKQDAYTETGVSTPLSYAKLGDRSTTALMGVKLNHALTPRTNLTASLGIEQDINHKTDQLVASGVAELTSENFNNNIKRTRPVASAGAYYAVAKNQRLSGEVYYQQLPFQSTGSATAYFNYMIGF